MNLTALLEEIAQAARQASRSSEEIKLVAVTKGCSPDQIKQAYALGCRDFGESRVQEALPKIAALPNDIRWHFIGRLQKNKVTKVVGRFALIHSVDSLELAQKIAQVSQAQGVITPVLLEVNASGEETKAGLSPETWKKFYPTVSALQGISIEGLMTLAPLTEDEACIRHCFAQVRHLAQTLELNTLSMGMSHDFPLAIQEGATLLRIGSRIFGGS